MGDRRRMPPLLTDVAWQEPCSGSQELLVSVHPCLKLATRQGWRGDEAADREMSFISGVSAAPRGRLSRVGSSPEPAGTGY